MRLPRLKNKSALPKFEQIRFSGIDRSEYSSDGSICDMLNISTDEYPVLKTTSNKRCKSCEYEYPWYFDKANSSYVIAGKTEGAPYDGWVSGTRYASGKIVAANGLLYRCKANIPNDTAASYAPYCASQYWEAYTGHSFQYDGTWSVSKTYTQGNDVVYWGKEFYRNKTGFNPGFRGDSTYWKKFVPKNYHGIYGEYVAYKAGAVVRFRSSAIGEWIWYERNSTSSGMVGEKVPTNTTYWSVYCNNVWSGGNSYSAGDMVIYGENLYTCKKDGNCTPDLDTENWEKYSYATLYYDGKEVENLHLIPGKKECVYLNGYIVILPDYMYYNTSDGSFGYLKGTKSGEFTTSSFSDFYYNLGEYTERMCCHLGHSKNVSESEYKTGLYNTLKIGYISASSGACVTAVDYWIFDLRKIFSPGDVVNISQPHFNSYTDTAIRAGSYVVREVFQDKLIFDSNLFADSDFSKNEEYYVTDKEWYLRDVIFKKSVPEMDYLCVSNNRIWGCKDDTVYASGLGNCFSWLGYTGAETDPTYIDTGDLGAFTGCCEYAGFPIFFKENEMYRVFGSGFSTFSLDKIADVGVLDGCSESICTINSMLFFLSPQGVCIYTGGVPAVISNQLRRSLSDAMAGTDGRKYFINASDGKERRTYVYDTLNNVWSSEMLTEKPLCIVRHGKDLLYLSSDGNIYTLSDVSGEYGAETKNTETAYIEFNDFYEGNMSKKHFERLVIRASVDPEYDSLDLFVQYDSSGVWQKVGSIYNGDNSKAVREFYFFPRRCDHYKIKLQCKGKFTLYAIGG